jgi:FAD:protein FMN transferase
MPPERVIASRHFEAVGTTCSVFGVGLERDELSQAEEWVLAMGARLTRFSGDSELSRLNASAGRWFDVSDEMRSLLAEALRAHEASAGLVNIAVLPAMLAIGYTRSLALGPTAAAFETAGPLPALPDVLELDGDRAWLRPGCGLDLGGLAKGWIADRLCEHLGHNVLANVGGDLRAVGPGPAGDGWPVAVGGTTLLLRDQGAATSSVRKRRWGELHHLIDPRTGMPARSGLEEVSVVAETGVRAEVVAKTALLLGPLLAPAYCATNALACWLCP